MFFIYLLFSNVLLGQITGVCINEKREAIPYVNISVKGEGIGTVSDENGEFKLEYIKTLKSDTLRFSHLGYNSLDLDINQIKNTIILKENNELLEEVVIAGNTKFKTKEVGTINKSELITLYSFSKGLGNEIGKLIKVKKNREYELLECKIKIEKLDFKNTSLRLNFYRVISNNQIEKYPYNNENILVKVNKEGVVSIPLKKYNLLLDFDFLVSIEWIDYELKEGKNEKNLIEYASNVYNGPFFFRQNKNVKWEKRKLKHNIGLGISLNVNSYKK